MASKQLTVKAVLQYPEGLELGCSPDIKRFKLTKEATGDDQGDLYCRLVHNLSTVFPDINGVNYSLYWKDAEGDLVQFSTMGELQAAIDAMQDHVLRVYVIVHFDEIEETDVESDKEKKKGSKRVRFARAGRRFRRKVRRRRRSALSDPTVISKEYRTGARVLVRRMHQTGQDGEMAETPPEGNASLAQLSPEVRDFIQKIHEEWHSKLSTQRPTVVAKRMRMKQRSLPPGLERDHFLWLLRLMGRWHRRHAGRCRAMSGWSSGDTDADESGGEEMMLTAARRSRRKRQKRAKKSEQGAAKEAADEEEEQPGQHKVAREFRQAVRVLMKQIHKRDSKPAVAPRAGDDQEKATLAALKPEVQSFIQKVAEDWHAMLAEKKPPLVAKRMRKRRKTLPGDLQREHYLWLCRYFRRWHSRHAARCTAMSGWSSGEDEDHVSDEDDDEEETEAKAGKRKGQSSSESDSDDSKKKKKAVPKEFVKASRILVNRLHKKKTTKGDQPGSQEEATLASLSPEARAFVQSFAEEWDKKLTTKSPLIVAKRMRRKNRTPLPAGLGEGHVLFLCRFLSRWHGKNAAFCGSMGGWSSAETGGETSGEEGQSALRRRARRAALLEVTTASEQEDTDCVETACKPVSKEFRVGVRQWLNQTHKKPAAPGGSSKKQDKPAKDDKEKTTLSPEVQQFLQRFAEDWHRKMASSRPGAVSREMKAQKGSVSLPSRMEGEQYAWLCCFMARWHRKHAEKCDVMSAGGEMVVHG